MYINSIKYFLQNIFDSPVSAPVLQLVSELCSFLLVLLAPGLLVQLAGGTPGLVRADQLVQPGAALLRTERVDQPEGDLDQGKPCEDPASILGCQWVHQALHTVRWQHLDCNKNILHLVL